MQPYRVGIVGATGMVGQRFTLLLEHHPWFQVTCLAASARSAGKTYREAVEGRWAFKDRPIPANVADMTVLDASQVANALNIDQQSDRAIKKYDPFKLDFSSSSSSSN